MDVHYVLNEEAIKYCMQDNGVLARAMQLFREMILQMLQNQCDLIVGETMTIAGMIMGIYRKCFMPSKQAMGVMPLLGYASSGHQQSIMAVKYMEFLNRECQIW